jgi:predicted permease
MTPPSPGTSSPRADKARWLDSLAQDTRYAIRGLRKTPGFTLTVILVLALGVGANAAMYSLVDRLFFREPSGIVDPASVVMPTEVFQGGYMPAMGSANIDALRSSVKGLGTVALQKGVYQGIDRATGPRVLRVTDNYFPMLGVRMARGRTFAPDEAADSLPVAVVSYRYWQRTLDGDSAVLGHSIEIAQQRYTVIGVTSPAFTGTGLEATDVWLPMSTKADGGLIMRLNTGVTRERVEAAMTVALRQGLRPNTRSGYTPPVIRANPLVFGRQSYGGGSPYLEIIIRVAGVAAIILLVAIANVATLLLMRATRRSREIAVRLALGVSRGRLMRLLMVEGALLSLAAGAAALVAGVWGGAVARARFMPFYRLTYPLIDWRFVTFTLGIAIAAGLLASVAPTIQASRPDLTHSLKAGARGQYRRSWFRGSLVVAQAALSVVLVVGAGLFVRSLHNIHSVPLGIDIDQLTVASASFQRVDSGKTYLPLMQQEAERLASIPGVQGAAVSLMAPMQGEMGGMAFRQGGDTMFFNGEAGLAGNAVGPGYFATVGIRLVDGRDFTTSDVAGSAPVVVLSESAARAAWPGKRAVGQCMVLGRDTNPCTTVVGVVSDANLVNITPEPGTHYYLPVTQYPYIRSLAITVRAPSRTRAALAQAVRHDLTGRLPASTDLRIEDLRSSLDPRYAQWTEGAVVFTAMGILALIVAAIGMYSIIGYSVSQRMHEMGVRVALGARRGQVMRPVIVGGLKLAALGVVLGIGAALVLGKLVASLLYNTSPRDPVAMVAAAVILLLASVAAAFVPARRAARVDPVIALRAE